MEFQRLGSVLNALRSRPVLTGAVAVGGTVGAGALLLGAGEMFSGADDIRPYSNAVADKLDLSALLNIGAAAGLAIAGGALVRASHRAGAAQGFYRGVAAASAGAAALAGGGSYLTYRGLMDTANSEAERMRQIRRRALAGAVPPPGGGMHAVPGDPRETAPAPGAPSAPMPDYAKGKAPWGDKPPAGPGEKALRQLFTAIDTNLNGKIDLDKGELDGPNRATLSDWLKLPKDFDGRWKTFIGSAMKTFDTDPKDGKLDDGEVAKMNDALNKVARSPGASASTQVV